MGSGCARQERRGDVVSKEPYRESAGCSIDHNEIEESAYQRGIKKGRSLEASETRVTSFLKWCDEGGYNLLFAYGVGVVGLLCLWIARGWPSKPPDPPETTCTEYVMHNYSDRCPLGHIVTLDDKDKSPLCRCPDLQRDGGAP
jgi:hypothetical protein